MNTRHPHRLTLTLAFALAACAAPGAADAALVAWYTFDSDYQDYSGNNNDGTLVDVGTAGNSGISNAAGESVFGGGAMQFSADRDRVDIPTQTFGSGNDYSVSFWARQAEVGREGMVIGRAGDTQFFIHLSDNAGRELRWRSVDATNPRQADFTFTDDAAWHHYALVAGDYDGDSNVDDITLYRDGVYVGTDFNNSTGFIFDDIGDAYDGSIDLDFRGWIDEVRIYDNALNAIEVGRLFRSNATVPTPGALGAGLALIAGLGLRRPRRGVR